ncbi:PIN domain-containing protein [Streptosporangium subroseum]|uniref:PIN domain-containing protein n=1 Tax=Streptosporangium subroseum TaxID=106412 RepID=UPI0034318CA8
MSNPTTKPPTYLDRLLADLDEIHASYNDILSASAIINIDPNRNASSDVFFVGAAEWGWATSDAVLEASRMKLLRHVRDWEPRFRLLFPHPTPTVSERLDEHIGRLEQWLVRNHREHGVPSTVDKATETIGADVKGLRALAELLPPDEYAVRLTVDTNTLIDNPDLAAHVPTLGRRYMAHLLPVVLREVDDLKRAGKNEQLRDAAKRAERRLKGLRTNGDIRSGVRVAGDVYAVFEHIEPRNDKLPSWLDLTVPDDRFVASSLLLQSAHPGSALYVATSDINLQTKLSAIGLPFIELP